MIKPRTPFHIEGLFGYWLATDCDTHWVQIPTVQSRYSVLIAGGMTGANRRHELRWRCPECGGWLGDPLRLSHGGTPESFLEAQAAAVDAFNEYESARTCGSCGSVHPPAKGFASAMPGAGPPQLKPQPSVRRRGPTEPLAEVDELQDGVPLLVEVDDVPVSLRRVNGAVHAVANICPHKAGPLGLGEIRNGAIICPWHRFRFDLGSGRSLTDPDLVATGYPVEIREGLIFLGASATV